MRRNGLKTTSPRAVVGALGEWWQPEGTLYVKLAGALRTAMAHGDIATGARLPAERTLAATLKVSRTTVVAAYALLEGDGWLDRRQGSGTWVRHPRSHEPVPYRNGLAVESMARNPLIRSALNAPGATVDFSASRQTSIGPLLAELMIETAGEVSELAGESGYQLLGLPALRVAIADFLSTACGLATAPEQILVTTGSQQAIWLVGQLYAPYGESVVLESPTYPGAIDAFRVLGARLHPLPVDPDGFRLDGLRALLGSCQPRLLVVAPTCHTPTGALMPDDQRRQLVAATNEYQVTVVEDRTMADLLLTPASAPAAALAPPPATAPAPAPALLPLPLAAISGTAPVITIGSLSKLFWPGLRIGWIRAPQPIVEHLSRLKAVNDMGSSLVTEALAARLLAHVDRVRELRVGEIHDSLDVLTAAFARLLPEWTWRRPSGGLSFWAHLPAGNATAFVQIALLYGVTVTPGSALSVDAANGDCVRLQFVQSAAAIELGVKRLAHAWRSYASQLSGASGRAPA